jgi:5-methylcytosine-specific restriction endonuclease McrA
MQNLKALSNETLHQTTQILVSEERRLTTSILWHLNETQSRRLHLELGYGSLFEYAIKALGYSEAAAGRRISSMRLLVEVPEVEPALENGDLSLSTLCTLQHFFQRKEGPVSKQDKKALVFSLQGKSRRECEKELAALNPKACAPAEKERVITPTQTEIRFVADNALLEKLTQIRELDAHVLRENASYLQLFHRMADLTLKALESNRQARKSKRSRSDSKNQANPATQNSVDQDIGPSQHPIDTDSGTQTEPSSQECFTTASRTSTNTLSTTPPAESRSRHTNERWISAAMKREVWRRDHGQCSYVSPQGKRCGSRFALEIDHQIPLALGGKTDLSNLRLLCRAHNTHQAIARLGEAAMRPFVRTYGNS